MTFNPLEDSEDAKAERARLEKPTLSQRYQAATAAGQPVSEDELRRQLGAKDVDDPTASKYAATGPSQGAPVARKEEQNPFVIGLVVVGAVLSIVGIILYIIAASAKGPYGESDPAQALLYASAGTIWIELGGVVFLVAIAVAGIGWYLERNK